MNQKQYSVVSKLEKSITDLNSRIEHAESVGASVTLTLYGNKIKAAYEFNTAFQPPRVFE